MHRGRARLDFAASRGERGHGAALQTGDIATAPAPGTLGFTVKGQQLAQQQTGCLLRSNSLFQVDQTSPLLWMFECGYPSQPPKCAVEEIDGFVVSQLLGSLGHN